MISSFAIAEPSKKTDSAAVFGNAGLYYVSGENIYICEDDYSGEETEVAQTCIRKIGYKDGVLEAKGQTKIDGCLLYTSVMCGGKVSGIVDPREVTKEEIGLMMIHTETAKEKEAGA